MFDPGQGMPMFDGDDLNRFVRQASWLAFNVSRKISASHFKVKTQWVIPLVMKNFCR